ncbi:MULTISPECIES: DNA translocase FtsK [unclassified Mesorhizobium]|uniref:DNA translocase FtsK n=1 Tax=unclassified Mesorhizobium TaxID=325217 RepID=UPI000FDC0FDF|nr:MULTISPECIES: DNA translocase FtsK [unclassified Mesorhizobium]TGS11200.1 DNA translocase FtsK [Mesorhizobium sp. M2E.F.Ca.ET.209.01.1.1]TGT73724.1 DNA translocase FtsK [Mesorhizobium sp. M2E.F.Ca.ET.166.01.1.1]TGW00239.1 DNA translocase FtsK [Mesorhizobium sp. M2E.F.Ca.ET.154.01.1.1]
MTSMRFPRANLSGDSAYQGDNDHGADGRRGGVPQAQAGQVVTLRSSNQGETNAVRSASSESADGGEFHRPAWQDYFFLAPNVRFTRTPDTDLTRRAAPQEDAAPAKTPARAPVRPAPATPPANSVRTIPAAPAVRAAAPAQAKPVVGPSAATPVAPAAPPQPTAAPAQKPRQSGLRWSYLSDHAFFEFGMPFLAERLARARLNEAGQAPAVPVSPPVRPMPAPAAQPIPPRAAFMGEATSFYRVIEWRSNAADMSPAPAPAPAPPQVAAQLAPAENMPVPAPASARMARQAPSLPIAGEVVPLPASVGYELPSEELLQMPPEGQGFYMSQERMEQNADLLESVLEDFGVKGEIIHVRPGPVVTLYEFEPAPGVKSSRVIGLADDIARSMSAISARVAVVPGRNVIGIELPNETRETVYFRELIGSAGFRNTSCKLALGLGKTIGGEPVIAELAKMPHLLVAGTTGSGKSVAINTMILSLLYRMKPEECRLIMVDPKMLELSVYDGIPHLLTPVVTDPKKAVTALKWAVREMEDRYRKMARLGVRNIDGYNQRAAGARDKGEVVTMQVQAGFEKGTGEPLFEERVIDLAPMPYIVIIVDEMADLMMVAGKEIEGAIQRLAQMARAAGIHLIMATQRPSVDVITGTIKANFPTRISFQVTSKIDSRTILGEQGAEQLLGQGDMLHMAGGGRISRVHGPFVSDLEVEHVVAHLKAQGRPEYLDTVTADEEEAEEAADSGPVFDKGPIGEEDGDALFEEAVKVVKRDKKCSTSYIQRRLGVGYNRAASLVERMEKEGLVGAPNHVGKREILTGRRDREPEREETD